MKILVCFKAVPNWEKVLDADWDGFAIDTDIAYAGTGFNCFDESALELALRLKDARGASCTAVTVGRAPSASLTEALYAAGFDEVVVIAETGAEFEPALVSARLAAFIEDEGFELVLTGLEAGMADTGLVPHFLAARLGLPLVAGVQTVDEIGETPAVVSVGNTPAVLRAVNLRARLAARGRLPRVVGRGRLPSSPTAHPVRDDGNPPVVSPVLTRSQTGRVCEFIDSENPAEIARILINQHVNQLSDTKSNENIQSGLREMAQKHPGISVFDAGNGGFERFSRLVLDTDCGYFVADEIVAVGDERVTVRKRCCASNLVWTADLSYPVALMMGGAAVKTGVAVICGTGVKTRENVDAARLLARRLGADFALTRPAALCGWGSPEEIVGQSGMKIAPEIALVFGASGAGAFLAGIEKAGRIIAVNNDPRALIFGRADVGVIADAAMVLGALLEEIGEGESS